MRRYHGTDSSSADSILLGQIDVSKGGGELGQGFYVGNLAHQAFAWAYHKGKQYHTGYKVIAFDIDLARFNVLNRKYLSRAEAKLIRKSLRSHNQQHRTFRFNGWDAIIAPIVGKYIPYFMQIKFEGKSGQDFINDTRKFVL